MAKYSLSDFEGKVFAVTGTLELRSQDEVRICVEVRNGIFKGGVTKKTNYLVVGEKPGPKLEKAKELGLTILTEQEFELMLKDVKITPEMSRAYLDR